ncbi:1655_t:CDS:2 [Acaulospora colombiana]|uniref:1655_t:CDS:1 n=1 Tax=Acaulospora colombiana TaxID=27376 RepID=A0ACA9PXR7_9GLOM|nr:1655_t:CDS:2 [Acaulospora colombiana]
MEDLAGTIHVGTTKEDVVEVRAAEGDPTGDPGEPDLDDPHGECEIGDGDYDKPPVDSFVCKMRPKVGVACNLTAWQRAGGQCNASDPSTRVLAL